MYVTGSAERGEGVSKYSEVDLTNPKDVVQVLKARWFWCIDGDSQRGIIYNTYSPQCNKDKSIAERFPVSDCVKDADAVILITEWNEFRNLDMQKVKSSMKSPNLFDGRNIYNPKIIKNYGFKYFGVGRK